MDVCLIITKVLFVPDRSRLSKLSKLQLDCFTLDPENDVELAHSLSSILFTEIAVSLPSSKQRSQCRLFCLFSTNIALDTLEFSPVRNFNSFS